METDAAQRGMLEGFGDGPDDAKSKRLPQPHGDGVRFHDGVELHRGVPLLTSPGERVLAERAPHSSALHLPGDHEARGCDVRARAGAVGTHVRRPENPRAVAGHDRAAGRGYYPYAPCLLGGPSRVIGEGLARGDDLPEDGPDILPVGIGVSSNLQCSLLTKASGNRQPSARGRPFSVDGCVPYAHTDVAPGSSTAACPERPHLDRCPRAASPAAPVALKHGRIDAPV